MWIISDHPENFAILRSFAMITAVGTNKNIPNRYGIEDFPIPPKDLIWMAAGPLEGPVQNISMVHHHCYSPESKKIYKWTSR